MIHSFPEHDLQKVLSIEETTGQNTMLKIKDTSTDQSECYFLTKKELEQFIGVLLHIQAKKRKDLGYGNR